jgi:hypothetical protein
MFENAGGRSVYSLLKTAVQGRACWTELGGEASLYFSARAGNSLSQSSKCMRSSATFSQKGRSGVPSSLT